MDLWKWVLDVDLWGVIHGVRAFLPLMKEQGIGHIVNTASTAGLQALPGIAPYNVAKFGVVVLSETLRGEVEGTGLGVSVLCPGSVRTRIVDAERNLPSSSSATESATADRFRTRAGAMLAEQGMPPEDVADMVVDAISTNRFWIITHDDWHDVMERRAAGCAPANWSRVSGADVRQRRLGSLDVGAVGFGAMVLSPGLYGAVERSDAVAAIDAALDAGCTLIDTSDGYGKDCHNERLLGELLIGRRDRAVVATKFGYRVPDGAASREVHLAHGSVRVNAAPELVRHYATESLRRLGAERIQLYSPHIPDPAVPIEDTVGAIAELVTEGLVGEIGLSNVDADQLERAAAVAPIAAIHCEWSMWTMPDRGLLAAADRLGVGVIAWAPLGNGLLTGTLTALDPSDLRNRFPRTSPDNLARNRERFEPLRDVATSLGCEPSQLALAWLLHQHPSVVPIPASRSPQHITANAGAADLELLPDMLDHIESVRSNTEPIGATIFGTGAATR